MRKVFFLMVGAMLSIYSYGQQKGEWRARLRATYIQPEASAQITTIGGSVDISKMVIPELDFTYFLAKNVSANLILGTSRHKVTATGTKLGDVELGKVWLLPPTLTFAYHIPVAKGVLPYVGAGVNYTIFYGKKNGPAIADMTYKNKFAFAAQLGADFDVSKKWFINVDIKKIGLKTQNDVTTVPAAGGATVHSDTKINPWLFSLGVGLKF